MSNLQQILEENKHEVIKMYSSDNLPSSIIALKYLNNKSKDDVVLRFLKKHNVKIKNKNSIRNKSCKKVNEDYFNTIDSHEKAYWLGFLYADGCISYRGNTPYRITLTQKEDGPIKDFKDAIQSEHNILYSKFFDKRQNKIYNRCQIQVSSKKFAAHVYNTGLHGKNNYATKFPIILNEFQNSFIRGLFDGDGSVVIKNKDISKMNIDFLGTESILKTIRHILISQLNIKIRKITPFVTNPTGSLCYMQFSNKTDLVRLIDFIYKDSTPKTRLFRKYTRAMSYKLWYSENISGNKIYTFIKDGTLATIKDLNLFCIEHNLNLTSLRKVIQGICKHHNNWKLVKIN